MFEFGNLWAWLMLPLPILFALGLRPAKLQQSALKVPYFDAIKGGSERSTRRGRNLLLLSLIWLLLVGAAAGRGYFWQHGVTGYGGQQPPGYPHCGG